MSTRNADNPKSPILSKKTTPARKQATKTPPAPSVVSQQSSSESTVTPNRVPCTGGKDAAMDDTAIAAPETPVEAVKGEGDTTKVTPETKSGNKRIIKRVIKRTIIKTKPKSVDAKIPPATVSNQQEDSEVPTAQESVEKVKDVAHVKQEDLSPNDVGIPLKDDTQAEDVAKDVEDGNVVHPSVENVEKSPHVTEPEKSLEHHEPEVGEKEIMETEKESLEIKEPNEEGFEIEKPDAEKQAITLDKEIDAKTEQVPTEINMDGLENKEPVDMEKSIKEEFHAEEDSQERLCLSDEEKDKDIVNDGHEEDDEMAGVKAAEHGELRFREHEDFTEAAEERKRRKEFEIFVGGLSRDATEEDVKKVFQNAGEVVDVRMNKEFSYNKNRGYAFVRFANKEHVARALADMKNPVIRGKRCGTAPSEDNDTLFVGNICNSWTKEAIRQKLKDYGVDGVERITLVPDPKHEGLSRGFAFVEFSCHLDAMLAYKRLQKPNAIFGHPERTAKVAFAEPLREPDPKVLAQVKSVFIDGLPAYWDEDTVRDHLNGYGTIERIMLARNMTTAKRKDFGFVDFSTHEAALACIDGINKRKLGDDKLVVRARLSNPLPKTQAVKGGIAGGFPIGHGSGDPFPRAGWGSSRTDFQRGRSFYQRGPPQTRGMGFVEDYPPPFRGRHSFGGRWDDYMGPHESYVHSPVPPRYVDRPRYGANMHRDHSMPMRRQPYMAEEQFRKPYGRRPYEDPYMYGDNSHGMKRPYFAEQDTDYTEPSRGRPRFDYFDAAISAPGARYSEGGIGGPPRDYYNYDYSSYYGDQPYAGDRPYPGDRPYGGRY